MIILLDEPGLTLHGKAQQDLVRYMNEKLRPDFQVIYTAHSPFMIDVEHIFSLRTVEDVVDIVEENGVDVEIIRGTKVGKNILSRDEDTLFPLQGVMGFDLAQTLFVGPYVVIVEGPTEFALLHWFSRQLTKRGRSGLDIRYAICPAESASKVSGFISLFKGRGLKIVALLDYHDSQKRMVDELEQSSILEAGHLFRTTSYAMQDQADIEDLIGRDMYVFLVNGALNLPESLKVSTAKLADSEMRVVKQIEAYCRTLPPGIPEFNHYKPAEYLLGLSDDQLASVPGLEDALGRFERLFADFNALIKK